MPMPIRQQSIRIQDITPPKMMDESACLKKLTTYQAYTIRKCPPRDPKKEGWGTWARAEVIEERLAQEDIIKQIKKLGEKGRSVADKKKALAHNMQGQITTLVDDLASKERDRFFEWSLVQLDTVKKPVSLKSGKKGGLYETVTMTAYVKRSPLKDLNPVILFQNIEKMKADSMRPPPPPQAPPPAADEIVRIEGGKGGGSKNRAQGRSKSREKKFHDHGDSSSGDSFDSDTDSHSSFTGSDSLRTSISSRSRDHRRHSHGRGGAFRSHSRHREPRRKTYYLEQPRPHSPEHIYDSYGGTLRPYVPDIPRQPPFDPVAAAYQAGKADADAERYGTADRVVARPVERVIERVIEPRPVISYGMAPRQEHRFSEPRFIDERYVDDFRRDDEYLLRRREAEEYIDGRRPSEFIDRRPTDGFYDRRQSEPVVWTNRHPFSPITTSQLPRRYPPSSSSGW
jgi:hypothetical protein